VSNNPIETESSYVTENKPSTNPDDYLVQTDLPISLYNHLIHIVIYATMAA
jgi:hypothetical protein